MMLLIVMVVMSITLTCCVHQKSLPKPLLLLQPAIAWHHSGDPKHKRLSLSLWLSDAQTTGFTLSSGKITQMLSTKYFQPHERIFLWLHVLPKLNVIATTFNPRRRSKRRKRFLPFPGICLAGRKSCHCCPGNVKVWYFMWSKVITRVQEIISTISNIFEERHSEAKIWILCVDLQIFSAESLPRPPLTCSDHRPARMYNENLLKPYI